MAIKSETREALEEIRDNLKIDLIAVTEMFANYTYDDDRIDDMDFIRLRGSIENAVDEFNKVLKKRKKR